MNPDNNTTGNVVAPIPSSVMFPVSDGMDLEGGAPNDRALEWRASEYVNKEKGVWWYVGLFAVMGVFAAVAIFFRQYLSAGLFVVMSLAIFFFSKRPPREISYSLDSNGLTIDGKSYDFSSFKSFGLLRDLSWRTIDFESTRRFMPRITVLYNDADLDDILQTLNSHLPRADRSPDPIERITHALRF